MKMKHDGIEIYCLPDGAKCCADDRKRNPLYIDQCPMGYEECCGDCEQYAE